MYYALHTCQHHEGSLDSVIGMLEVFHFNVYTFLDPDATFSLVFLFKCLRFLSYVLKIFLVHFISLRWLVIPFFLNKTIGITHFVIFHKVTHVDLVELCILYFDVILGMNWLKSSYASIGYRTWLVKFQVLHEPFLEWKKEIMLLRVISYL